MRRETVKEEERVMRKGWSRRILKPLSLRRDEIGGGP